MTRQVAVLRPEPGNAATIARVTAAGLEAISLPLFAVHALDWAAPDPAAHDALLLTSANAIRLGGQALAALRSLPVFAVGDKTAAAARLAGFDVMATGDSNAIAILSIARSQGYHRVLHIGARERSFAVADPVTAAIAVYASDALPVGQGALGQLAGTVALLHSARAARHFGALVDAAGIARGTIAVSAISQAVAASAGLGWAGLAVAASPDDEALIAAARSLTD